MSALHITIESDWDLIAIIPTCILWAGVDDQGHSLSVNFLNMSVNVYWG